MNIGAYLTHRSMALAEQLEIRRTTMLLGWVTIAELASTVRLALSPPGVHRRRAS
jgi:hypothetical protein